MRQAKQYGGEYARYVRRHYQMSKIVRTKGIKLREMHEGHGVHVLDYKSFIHKNATASTGHILKKEFMGIKSSSAEALTKALSKVKGRRVSYMRIRVKNISEEE